LEVVKAEPRVSEESGNWRVEVACKIHAGQETGDDYVNRQVFTRLFFNTVKATGEQSKAQGMARSMIELMLGEVLPRMREGPAGTPLGLNRAPRIAAT
jgi:hypothetical protein